MAVIDRLDGHQRIAVKGQWTRYDDEWSLHVCASLAVDPIEDIAFATDWFVVFEPQFREVGIYPCKRGGVRATFHHQSLNGEGPEDRPWRAGNPCLHRPVATFGRQLWSGEPEASDEKIVWYLERLLSWLDAAATDTLVVDGDAFELPWGARQNSFPVVGFMGSEDDLDYWFTKKNEWGWADLAQLPFAEKTYVITCFRDSQFNPIREPAWGPRAASAPVRRTGIWISLDSLPVLHPWELPQTWADLTAYLTSVGVNLPEVFEQAGAESRRRTADGGMHMVFLGFPISERVGSPPVQQHWLAIGAVELSDRKTKRDGFRTSEKTHRLTDRARPIAKSRLRWVRTSNWEAKELRTRAGPMIECSERRVLMIGAGALGGGIASRLVRMGMTSMSIIDPDRLDMGNLTRHELQMDSVGHSKAVALARALSSSMPDARVEGTFSAFPPTDKEAISELRSYDVVIDCTASDTVLSAMADFEWGGEKTFISIGMTWQAEGLLVFTASESSFPAIDAKARFAEMDTPVAFVDDALMEGVGCWHPVFPATAADVGLWASIGAKEIMKSIIDPQRRCVYFQQKEDGTVTRHDG